MAGVAANASDKAGGQHSFLDALAEETPSRSTAAPAVTVHDTAGDFLSAERLRFEKDLLGFYVSGHPMNVFAGLADAINTYADDELLRLGDRAEFPQAWTAPRHASPVWIDVMVLATVAAPVNNDHTHTDAHTPDGLAHRRGDSSEPATGATLPD